MEILQPTHPYVKVAKPIVKCAIVQVTALPAPKDTILLGGHPVEAARSVLSLLLTVSPAVILTHVLNAKPELTLIQVQVNVLLVSVLAAHAQAPTNVRPAHKDFGSKETLANHA